MDKRLIVITGATRGLGRALVESLSSAGHRVIGCGRTASLVEAIGKKNASVQMSVVDVLSPEDVQRWADGIIEAFGPPSLLINNAAVMNPVRTLWEMAISDFKATIDTNVTGVFHVIKAFVPAMVAAKAGVVVNLSSGWGRSTSPQVAPYCASKFAIEGMTKALAQELPRGMAAVPLNPGIIDTDMLRSAWGDSAGNYMSPAKWALKAAPFLLGLGPTDNGKSLTVPT